MSTTTTPNALPDGWQELTEERADEFLCVLPPIYFPGGFAVSEPHNHTPEGIPTYQCVVTIGARYFGRVDTIKRTRAAYGALLDALGKMPAPLRVEIGGTYYTGHGKRVTINGPAGEAGFFWASDGNWYAPGGEFARYLPESGKHEPTQAGSWRNLQAAAPDWQPATSKREAWESRCIHCAAEGCTLTNAAFPGGVEWLRACTACAQLHTWRKGE